uniref:DUF5681 domain-containing protein n=1 Tax=viral metagenome TaxID=1070528 RepID=A0A6M3J5U3_9ZZZZ
MDSETINVENNKKTTEGKLLGGVTGKGFMPGVSGNPGGRPKNTIKSFLQTKFREMTDEEKEKWLEEHKVSGELMWKMAEGNPSNDIDMKVSEKKLIKLDE